MPTARGGVGLRHVYARHAPYRKALIAWCNLALVLWICASHAAMLNISIEELARKADTIVLGTVTQQASAWDDQHTAIHTDVTVEVEQGLTGLPGEVVTLRVLGGVVGGMGMGTSNDATFRVGERVIVCLDTNAVPNTVVGMRQGKFTVEDNMVIRADETWSLDEFIAAVRTAAR
jgi:hypothetical protein